MLSARCCLAPGPVSRYSKHWSLQFKGYGRLHCETFELAHALCGRQWAGQVPAKQPQSTARFQQVACTFQGLNRIWAAPGQ